MNCSGVPEKASERKSRYVLYVVLALAFSNGVVLASIQTFNLAVEPVRAALNLSDVQLSVLQGFAFGVCAAFVGIPVARIADRGWRRDVIVFGAIVWSIGTAICALSVGFWQMFLGRSLVGVGEVFFLPSAISLLEDTVPHRYSAFAMGFFVSGSTIGSAFAWLGGGWLLSNWRGIQHTLQALAVIEGWRAAFLIYAMLGAMCAVLMVFVREPVTARPAQSRSILEEIRSNLRSILIEERALAGIIAGVVLLGFGGSAIFMWLPSVFVRSFRLGYAEVGDLLGVSFLIFCTLGSWSAGAAADLLRAKGRHDAPILILIGSSVCCSVSLVALASAGEFGPLAIAALACSLLFVTMATVMGPYAIAECAPPHVRSQALAVQYFLMYLIPIGLAPSIVAVLTSYVFRLPRDVDWSIAVVFIGATVLSSMVFVSYRKAYAERTGHSRGAMIDRGDPADPAGLTQATREELSLIRSTK